MEKVQDNISKRAAVEKEPLSLKKDKEDPSKYYLSYPKPPFLHTKWANRDINVVEWANITKFSTLDDLVTPFRLLKLFFYDVLVDMIFGYTKLYSHRKKADISFEITNEKIRLFISMLLLSGCCKILDCKMYLEATPETFVLLCKQGLIQCLVILRAYSSESLSL